MKKRKTQTVKLAYSRRISEESIESEFDQVLFGIERLMNRASHDNVARQCEILFRHDPNSEFDIVDNIYNHRLLVTSPDELSIKNYAAGAYKWVNDFGYDMLSIYDIESPSNNTDEHWMSLLNGDDRIISNGSVDIDNIESSNENLMFRFRR